VKRGFIFGFSLGVFIAAALATTSINPVQGLQVGKNLTQYFLPGKGWFVDSNTATMLTKLTQMSGACGYLNSTNGTTNYTYDLGPACQALTVYTKGMRFWLTADTKCPASCTLNINQVNKVAIKRSDGTTDPGGIFDFTQGVPVWFDGLVFRIEWQTSASVAVASCVSPASCSGLFQVTVARGGQQNLVIIGPAQTTPPPAGSFPSPSFVINGN
jgi:hypothetical protein